MQETVEYSHPGLAQFQDCRTRILAASKTDPVYRDRAERAEQRKIDFYAKEVERIDHPRRASVEPSIVPEPPSEDKEGEDHISARDVSQNRTCQVKYPFQDQTRRFDTVKFDFNSDLSWSFFKQWCEAYIQ